MVVKLCFEWGSRYFKPKKVGLGALSNILKANSILNIEQIFKK